MGWKGFVTDYFTFSKKERIGILVILALVVIIFFLPQAVSTTTSKPKAETDSSWIASVKKLEGKENNNNPATRQYDENNSSQYQYDRSAGSYYGKSRGELFYFDPNTISLQGWQKLGLRDKTISTIQNYLAKGGKFRKTEDLQRVYGLHKDEYERLAPYVRIEISNDATSYTTTEKNTTGYIPASKRKYEAIDINTGDTTAFIALPGIGSKLAARIINFRDKLGGFYSINQVGETFGLPDSTFQRIKQYLKLENTSIKKININTATIDELKAHPYIRYSLANPVVAYRNQHGLFEKVEDIKKVMVVTNEIYNKISPYLTVQ